MSQVTDYILPPEGRAYKENVPDTRESPVREMVKELKEFGIKIYGYDPLLSKEEIEDYRLYYPSSSPGVLAMSFSENTLLRLPSLQSSPSFRIGGDITRYF